MNKNHPNPQKHIHECPPYSLFTREINGKIVNQFEKLQREIGVSIALSDIEKQLESLTGKDKKALSAEFQEWITGAEDVIVSHSRNLRSTTSFSLSGGVKETIRNEILNLIPIEIHNTSKHH